MILLKESCSDRSEICMPAASARHRCLFRDNILSFLSSHTNAPGYCPMLCQGKLPELRKSDSCQSNIGKLPGALSWHP